MKGEAGRGWGHEHGLFGELGTGEHEAGIVTQAQVPRRHGEAGQGSGGKGTLNLVNSLKFTLWVKALMGPDKVAPRPVLASPLFRAKATWNPSGVF